MTTPPDGSYTAVVDRIEESLAVLQVEGTEELYELVVEETVLPADGCRQDAVLQVTLRDGALVEATYLDAETQARSDAAQNRFDRLSTRLSEDDESA
ncbi:DUF3006 family protein [Haloarculaceae archaeon H-GB2-1]|nr:DUF3006 family protein [Haloarculaceae archaeon H-GB1-1]MEA5409607.1 DUF3006 family protein [Haloarculaceae archaeon H-GB2-1]